MRLFIPPLGTRLYLLKPWTFKLHCEERNQALWDLIHPSPMEAIPTRHRHVNQTRVTLLPGDQLVVDRIFIRKGARDYDSVTFIGFIVMHGVKRRVRFWVSLEDANKIEYTETV
jgi:hypothetical protein